MLHQHPAVLSAAVVARPDDKWGEVPCAFVELKAGAGPITEEELIAFCRDRLARFKCPGEIRFITLPKTATERSRSFAFARWPAAGRRSPSWRVVARSSSDRRRLVGPP